ncbi:hypothetical protein [Parabacteroides sp.]
MSTKEEANIILQQLGGNKFIVMTGSKYFVYDRNEDGNTYLRMKLTRNRSKAQYLRIILNSSDLYDMIFYRFDRKDNHIVVKEHNNVYCDQLQELFTETTGLYTHL